MKYTKPSLSFGEQAELLIARGLVVEKSLLIERLRTVSYYRISGYLYPYRQPSSDDYIPGTKFETVWRHYAFDRRLRNIVMDAIERVEVCVRTRLICVHSQKYGPFGYCDSARLPGMSLDEHSQWLGDIRSEFGRSRERFVEHFKAAYGDMHKDIPIWMVAEIMSFGRMLTLYNGMEESHQTDVSRSIGLEKEVFGSWLAALNIIRNISGIYM